MCRVACIELVHSYQFADSKPLAAMLNPAIEPMMVWVVEMGSAKEFDTTIMNEALTSAVCQVEGTRARQVSGACGCTRPGACLNG